jgi:Ca2+-transporting ATPase
MLPGAHARPAAEVAGLLAVDPGTGLATAEAARRLQEIGENELPRPKPSSVPALLRGAFTEPFIVLLAVAGLLAVALGEVRDGLLVLVGLVPIVGADVITGYRAERALEALHSASAPTAHVRRAGAVELVLASTLVPGDVVVLRAGDVVPADLRVWRSEGLIVDRSILTGESLPEHLRPEPDADETELVERRALAHAGTSVVSGRGEGIVVATGARAEVGRIARGLATTERRRSPLQLELDRLVRILLGAAIGLIAISVGLGSCVASRWARTSWPASPRRSRRSLRSRPSSSPSSSAWVPTGCCGAESSFGG